MRDERYDAAGAVLGRYDLAAIVGERWDLAAILAEGPRPDGPRAVESVVEERWDWAAVRRERPWLRPVSPGCPQKTHARNGSSPPPGR